MPSRMRKAGFSLLEVIVTLFIIATLSSIVYLSGDYGLARRALSRSATEVDLLLQGARAQAILSGQDARLIVNFDETDPERFLRYVGIVERDVEDPNLWVASRDGVFLPEGIYIVPQSSTEVVFENWDESGSERRSVYRCEATSPDMAITALDYPEIDPVSDGGGESDWLVYQFSPDGSVDSVDSPICGSVGAASINNQIVLAPAERNLEGNLVFNDSSITRGLVIRRNGTSILINAPDDFFGDE